MENGNPEDVKRRKPQPLGPSPCSLGATSSNRLGHPEPLARKCQGNWKPCVDESLGWKKALQIACLALLVWPDHLRPQHKAESCFQLGCSSFSLPGLHWSPPSGFRCLCLSRAPQNGRQSLPPFCSGGEQEERKGDPCLLPALSGLDRAQHQPPPCSALAIAAPGLAQLAAWQGSLGVLALHPVLSVPRHPPRLHH